MTTANDSEGAVCQDRRTFIKKVVEGTVAGSLLLFIPATPALPGKDHATQAETDKGKTPRFVFVVDIAACIGCGSCCVADRTAYRIPKGRFRTWVERYVIDGEGGVLIDLPDTPEGNVKSTPASFRPVREVFYVPKLCRMCEEPPCREVCPTGATYRSGDGLVLIDDSRCIGCSACVTACPHSARFLDPRTGTAGKCSWCHERVRKGLLPFCVSACPAQARKFVDLGDRNSEAQQALQNYSLTAVKQAGVNRLNLFYLGARKEVI